MASTLEADLEMLGKEVDVADIDRELKEIWESDGAGTRASLMNFAIYSEAQDSLAANSQLLTQLTQEHACRALLIANLQSCNRDEASVRAWITAHCQIRGGQKSVCSEQLSFLLQCGGNRHVRNIVFSHLDSDLPLVFWWQGDLGANFEDRLYSVIDRLIIDSATWSDPLADFGHLQNAYLDSSSRFALNDLSWSRSLKIRRAVADCFEDSNSVAELSNLSRISLTHGLLGRIPALMVAAWIADRLKLTPKPCGTGFFSVEGREIALDTTADEESSTIGLLTLHTDKATFEIRRDIGDPYIRTATTIGDRQSTDLIPATRDNEVAHISAQLERAGNRDRYFSMVPVLEKLIRNSS